MPDKRWEQILFACNNERERGGGRGEGRGVIAFKAPVRISSKVSDKFLASFFSRAEKFSYSTRRRPLFPSCANLEQLYIYIYMPSSVDTFSSTSQTRPILVNFGRVAVAFVCTAFQTCLFDFTFTAFFSIFNPIFLFLSLQSRNEVILREPTRKLPNFRSFSFIFSLEITRCLCEATNPRVPSLSTSLRFRGILSGFRFNKIAPCILPRKRIGKKRHNFHLQRHFFIKFFHFYFIYPIYMIFDVIIRSKICELCLQAKHWNGS